jgi:hypothetical protein
MAWAKDFFGRRFDRCNPARHLHGRHDCDRATMGGEGCRSARALLVATWCSCPIVRSRGTPGCVVHNAATPARCGSGPLRLRIASTMALSSPPACSAASEQYCPSAVTALDAVRLTGAALGARAGAKLQRPVACVRRDERDVHRPRAHGAPRGRHSRQPFFRSHVTPLSRDGHQRPQLPSQLRRHQQRRHGRK